MAGLTVNLFIVSILSAVLCANAAFIKPQTVGGKNAQPDQFRYMVGLSTKTDYLASYIGGGAIISDRHILTSASIVENYLKKPEDLITVLGIPNLGVNFSIVPIEQIILHPDFNSKYLYNDLAILRTFHDEKIIFSASIQPIALPDADQTNESLLATVTGWGLLKVSF